MAQAPKRILLVDDKPYDAELAALVLRSEVGSVDVTLVTDAIEFAQALVEGRFDLVITERRLNWGDGLKVVETVRRTCHPCPIIFFTVLADSNAAFEAAKLGVDAYIVKGSAGYLQLPVTVRGLQQQETAEVQGGRSVDSLLERLPVALFSLGQSGELACLNPACHTLFCLSKQRGEGQASLLKLFVDDAERARFLSLLQAGAAVTDCDVRLSCGGERPFWVRINLWPREVARAPASFEGVAFETTDFKQMVSNLSLNAEELSRSNAELEKFAYVASHDLQEPLSYMSRYARLFSDRYRGQLDDDGVRYLGHILDSSTRLQSMVDDILAYSRISTQGSGFKPVDFAAAADAAAARLAPSFKDSGAHFERGPLPTLDADERQIEQLFQNLFSNALKFKGKAAPEIRVAAEAIDGCWRFSVEDNGIGVDPGAAERIFGMFQRLHTSGEYPGTGIGLAICRSIVERHGGKIWVESVPDQGSKFYFTIDCKASTANATH